MKENLDLCLLVFDDENECKITAGAVITLTVRIERENMSDVFCSKRTEEDEQIDEKEKHEKVRRTYSIDDIITYIGFALD